MEPTKQLETSFPSLADVATVDFDIFKLQEETNDNALEVLMHYLYTTQDFHKVLQVPIETFGQFVTKVQQGYIETNPYHNAVHAADVTQMFFVLLT